jgi:hypothetical protein
MRYQLSTQPHVDAGKTGPYMGLRFYQGADVATTFPFAARNTADERPFIVWPRS